MSLLLGAFTIGLILALLALGVYISFRLFNFPDVTAEGSITLGAASTAALLVAGAHPVLATVVGTLAGAAAGTMTGLLHTRFKINGLLAGILVMTALYSINLHVMGKSNVPLLTEATVFTAAEAAGLALNQGNPDINVLGWRVRAGEAGMLVGALLFALLITAVVNWFFRTELGTAMRATGDNPQMIRALGVNVESHVTLGLALSNGLVALAGSLLAQYQGFADVQMGIGMLVWGLASVIIGEALIGHSRLGLLLLGAVMGSVLFRLLVAIALRWGLNPNDLKLITALFVLAALVAPTWLRSVRKPKATGHA